MIRNEMPTPKKTRAQKIPLSAKPGRRMLCEVRIIALESGETVKRGCGQTGLTPSAVGWSCFYCGNYIFRAQPSLYDLWFHFKMGREYWRAMSLGGENFINGVPVAGLPDSLPRRLWADLTETQPPKWFKYFITFDEEQFQQYIETASL
jgi:hypothetical protein